MELKSVGTVHSNFKTHKDAPRQGRFSKEESTLEIYPEYSEALKGIEDLDYILVLYWGNEAKRDVLATTPRGGNREGEQGVFTIRSPNRPNPIASCVCEIIEVNENKIKVKGLDAFDESPILDIKIHVPELDSM